MSQSLAQVPPPPSKKQQKEAADTLGFSPDLQRLKSVVCEEEAIVGLGPVSKLQCLEK